MKKSMGKTIKREYGKLKAYIDNNHIDGFQKLFNLID